MQIRSISPWQVKILKQLLWSLSAFLHRWTPRSLVAWKSEKKIIKILGVILMKVLKWIKYLKWNRNDTLISVKCATPEFFLSFLYFFLGLMNGNCSWNKLKNIDLNKQKHQWPLYNFKGIHCFFSLRCDF